MSVTDLSDARREAGWPEPEDERVASIADRAESDEEPTQDELFPKGVLDADGKIQLKNLIRANEGVEVTASLMSAEVPLRGGLVDPRREGKVVVSYEAAKYIPVPVREGEPGDRKLVGWKIRCQMRPTFVEPADRYYSRDQVERILAEVGVPADSDRGRELLGDVEDAA